MLYDVLRCTLHFACCLSNGARCLWYAVVLLHVACCTSHAGCCLLHVVSVVCGSLHAGAACIAHCTLPTRLLRVRTRRCLPSTPPELAPHLPTPQHVCSMHVVAVLVTLNDFGILSVRNVQGRTVCDGSLVREHHTHGTGRNAVDRPGPRSNPEDCKTELTNLARPM